jgi:hypothetical protein
VASVEEASCSGCPSASPDILKSGTVEGKTYLAVNSLIWNVPEYFGTFTKTRQIHASLKCMLILSLTCMELWSWSHCTVTNCGKTCKRVAQKVMLHIFSSF